jgi:hypothetical protein
LANSPGKFREELYIGLHSQSGSGETPEKTGKQWNGRRGCREAIIIRQSHFLGIWVANLLEQFYRQWTS